MESPSRSLLDALVRLTVRRVLFDDDALLTPETEENSQDELKAESPARELLLELFAYASDPQEASDGFTLPRRVFECCCTWPSNRLEHAKMALKAFLRSMTPRDGRSTTSIEQSEARRTVFEAYALVKLILLEKDSEYRARKFPPASSNKADSDHTRPLACLRVQLALYARYFELANGRKVGGNRCG